MILVPELQLSRLASVHGSGESAFDLALAAARQSGASDVRAVIVATFSNPDRFPSLAVRLVSALGLPAATPAFDLQLACSAFPYAVYVAGRLAADLGGEVLVVDGDVQSPLVDPDDHATGHIFSDAFAACHVAAAPSDRRSPFAFLSRHDEALACSAAGPIHMDGFRVFSFVATEVSAFLREFGSDFDYFAPHQANPYMIRQLARTLGLESKLLTIPEEVRNPGSCSVVMALQRAARPGRALIAGFGAGYSAAAGVISLA